MAINPNEYEVRIWYEPEEGEDQFLAQVIDWPDVMADGRTREEAAQMIREVLELTIEAELDVGNPIPLPRTVEQRAAADRAVRKARRKSATKATSASRNTRWAAGSARKPALTAAA